MTHSAEIKEIAAALAKAQGEIQNVVKDAKNPHYKSDYATLDALTDTVRPIFSKHGLAVVQIPGFAEGVVVLDIMITHSSGQWISGNAGAPIPKLDPQGVGSATTYLRRYSLAGIAAIAQTDDDGNVASQPARTVPVAVAAPVAAKPDGYDNWLADMTSAADNGWPVLSKAFSASKPEYRQRITGADKAKWADLRAKAEKVKEPSLA